jgi:hypothetical protein
MFLLDIRLWDFRCLGWRKAWERGTVEECWTLFNTSTLWLCCFLGQTRTRVAWELRRESLHQSFLNSHALVKREQELHESWEASVYIRVFSTLMPWSNENKSCMRVEKREFASEFSRLSCPGQTRTRVAWELRSESLHQSFLNSHALVKREQELHESW